MVSGFAGRSTLDPRAVALDDLRRNLALGMEPQRDLVNTPSSRQEPSRLPPRIWYPLAVG